MDKQQLTINLIKSQIAHCKEFDKTDINYDGLYRFSAFHNVSNIVGKALFEQGIADNCENSVEFYTEQLKAVMDYQKQQFELERIKENFEKEKTRI